MPPKPIRILSAADVTRALPMPEAIAAMKRAFTLLSAGEVTQQVRTVLEAPERGGNLVFMPSYLAPVDRFAVKVVSLYSGNAARGLARIQSLVALFDGETGCPMAIMEGALLTALRTGAASGAATELLARTDASTAAILGAGVQARAQLEAVCAARPIRRARVYSPSPGRAAGFAAELQERLGLPVEAAANPAAALRGADVVCTATASTVPVFDDADLPIGAHLNAIGSYQPEVREVPGATVARARIFVDHREAAVAEAGDLLIPLREGLIAGCGSWTELGEVAAGRRPGRTSADEVTLFKTVGVAIQDLVAADAALAAAERLGLGTLVQL